MRTFRPLMLALLGVGFSFALGQQDAACRNTAGVSLAYAGHRFEAGDMSAVSELIPLEQRLPGFDWQFFLNQTSPSQSFMYPPQWRPSIVPADALAGDVGVRLDAPDGSAAMEVYLDGPSIFTPRGPVALEDVATYALSRLLGNTPYQVLCSDSSISPQMASIGIQNLFAAVSTASHLVVVKVYEFSSEMSEPSLYYIVYAGPTASFDSLVRSVFIPVIESFPKGGGGSCTCDVGEPDKDNDGTCDRCDDYDDDPNRQ